MWGIAIKIIAGKWSDVQTAGMYMVWLKTDTSKLSQATLICIVLNLHYHIPVVVHLFRFQLHFNCFLRFPGPISVSFLGNIVAV